MLINQEYKEKICEEPEQKKKRTTPFQMITLQMAIDLIDPDREGVTVGITTDWAEFDYLRTSSALFEYIRADAMVSGIGVEQEFIVLQLED